MPIQLIARELYRLHREIEALEKEAAAASGSRKDEIAEELRRLEAEYRRMRGILDGQKDKPSSKRRFD